MTVQERLAPGKYALRVEDYLMLADAGAFADERTELIGGDVIVMAPEYRPRAYVRDELSYRIRRALEAIGSDIYVMGGSVWLTDHDMPQPDIVLTREPRGDGAIPPRSVALLVEVSSTTLPFDLGTKSHLYAAANIPEYWVVDVAARVIHQIRAPDGGEYGERRNIAFGDPLVSATVAGLQVSTVGL